MNFTQSFEEFSKGLGPTDLMLYAGVALIAWILFKDRLSPLGGVLQPLVNNIKGMLQSSNKTVTKSPEQTATNTVPAPAVLAQSIAENAPVKQEDKFFKLIVSWKETRDLALECGCSKAVEVADDMFPFLSPNVCGKDNLDV